MTQDVFLNFYLQGTCKRDACYCNISRVLSARWSVSVRAGVFVCVPLFAYRGRVDNGPQELLLACNI